MFDRVDEVHDVWISGWLVNAMHLLAICVGMHVCTTTGWHIDICVAIPKALVNAFELE